MKDFYICHFFLNQVEVSCNFSWNFLCLDVHLMWFSVALNYQTTCEEMLINQARFKINGNTGYILKPPFLRNPQQRFDPSNPATFSRQRPIEYKFDVSQIYSTMKVITAMKFSAHLRPADSKAKRKHKRRSGRSLYQNESDWTNRWWNGTKQIRNQSYSE